MSMYTYILEAALRERSEPDTPLATGDAVAVLLECRRYLGSAASSGWSGDWGSAALADQVGLPPTNRTTITQLLDCPKTPRTPSVTCSQ